MWHSYGARCENDLRSGRYCLLHTILRCEPDANNQDFTIFSLIQEDPFHKRFSDDTQVGTLRNLAVVVCDACMTCNLVARLILYNQRSYYMDRHS